MENLGLEQIKNLPVYKCEVSRELTVMKRGLNSRAIVGENLHVKNYLWKSKEKEDNEGGGLRGRALLALPPRLPLGQLSSHNFPAPAPCSYASMGCQPRAPFCPIILGWQRTFRLEKGGESQDFPRSSYQDLGQVSEPLCASVCQIGGITVLSS